MAKSFTPDQVMEILKTAIQENGLHSVMDSLTEAVDTLASDGAYGKGLAYLGDALEVLENAAEEIQGLDD